MTSIDAMSKTEALEYMRNELQILSSILGELIPFSGRPSSINGSKKDAPEYRLRTVVTLSTSSQKWPLSGYRRNHPVMTLGAHGN
jgi:hypothetical protein